MKKRLSVLFLLLLAGCSSNASIATLTDPTPDQVIPASSEGITLRLPEQQFNGSPSYIETEISNDNDEAYEAGSFYHIEALKDGEWYIITYSDAVFFRNPHFRDGGVVIQGNSKMPQMFVVEELSVELPPGEYRLVKTVLHQNPYHEITIAAPFTVH